MLDIRTNSRLHLGTYSGASKIFGAQDGSCFETEGS
jgi:hypothetical protein